MLTVMVTFAQAMYALVTFVHISNFSAVTGPILTKLFGPNFYGVIIFVDQNVLGQTLSRPEILLGPKVIGQEILLDPKKISNSNFFGTRNFFRPKINFQTQNCFGPKFY